MARRYEVVEEAVKEIRKRCQEKLGQRCTVFSPESVWPHLPPLYFVERIELVRWWLLPVGWRKVTILKLVPPMPMVFQPHLEVTTYDKRFAEDVKEEVIKLQEKTDWQVQFKEEDKYTTVSW